MLGLAYFVLSVVLALLVRITFRVSRLPGFDFYGHQYFGFLVHSQRSGFFGPIQFNFVASTKHYGPFMWNWLVGFFPRPVINRLQGVLNHVIDAFFALTLYFWGLAFGLTEAQSTFVTALYLLTPATFSSVSIGPRLANFTPRLLSEVLVGMYFLFQMLSPNELDTRFLVPQIALVMVILSSSKFGTQALVFIGCASALFRWSLDPMAPILIGILIITVFSGGKSLLAWKTQISHLHQYFKRNQLRSTPIASRNSARSLLNALNNRRLLSTLYAVNSFTSTAIKFPSLLFALFLIAETITNQGFKGISQAEILVLATSLVFLAINARPLLFLGEAERYLTHLAGPISLYVVVRAVESQRSGAIWVLLLYGALLLATEKSLNSKVQTSFKSAKEEEEAIIVFLQGLPPTVMAGNPHHIAGGAWRHALDTHHTVLFDTFNNREDIETPILGQYPLLDLSVVESAYEEFRLEILVVDLPEAQNALRIIQGSAPISKWRLAFSSRSRFAVLVRNSLGKDIRSKFM